MATLVVKQSPGVGEYGSLSAAVSAAGSSDTISIQGSWTVDDGITSNIQVTDANLTIITDSSARHPGYYDESQNHYRLVVNDTATYGLDIRADGVTITGLAINCAGTTTGKSAIFINTSMPDNSTLDINDCVLYHSGSGSNSDGIASSIVDNMTCTVTNTVIHSWAQHGIHPQLWVSGGAATQTYDVNSCTIWGCDYGIRSQASDANQTQNVNVFNSIVAGNTTADFSEEGSGTLNWDIHYCMDSDGTITSMDAGAVGEIENATVTDTQSPGAGTYIIFNDITSADYDLRLYDNDTDNDAQEAHAVSSGAGLTMPSEDIVGSSRMSDYSIGAFHVVAAGGGGGGLVYEQLRESPTIAADNLLWMALTLQSSATPFTVFNYPNITPVVLIEANIGKPVIEWELEATGWRADVGSLVPVQMLQDGVALTRRDSLDDVNATAGSYIYIDPYIWVRPIGDTSPYYVTMMLVQRLSYSTEPKIFDLTIDGRAHTVYYDPRVVRIPRVNIRLEPIWSGVGQVGLSDVALQNKDAHFADFVDRLWDGATIQMLVGADRPGQTPMVYSDYAYIGSWRTAAWETEDDLFTLELLELKAALEKEIPFAKYNRSDYPGLLQTEEGKVVQIAYGQLFGREVVKVNSTAVEGRFVYQCAGHAIWSFSTVREVDSDGNINTLQPFNIDLTAATFECSPSDQNNLVVADFGGKVDENGDALLNPAMIVRDILVTLGEESNLDEQSFTDAAVYLKVGDNNQPPRTIHDTMLGIYLNDTVDAFDLISEINRLSSTYLFINASGEYVFGVHKPQPAASLPILDESDFLSFSITQNTEDIVSRVNAIYAENTDLEYGRLLTVDNPTAQYLHNFSSPKILNKTLQIATENAAKYWISKTLWMRRFPIKLVEIETKWQAYGFKVGDELQLQNTRYDVDDIFEILETNFDLANNISKLVLGDRRSFANRYSWVAPEQLFFPPEVDPLETQITAWSSAWTDAQKKYAADNYAFAALDNGYLAPSSDPGDNTYSLLRSVVM